MRYTMSAALAAAVTLLQSVSAHGGEEKEGLTNPLVILIALSACLVFYVVSNKFSIYFKQSGAEKYLAIFAVYTGVVHLLLGINDQLFLLGGFGVLSVIAVSSFTDFGRAKNGLFMTLLFGVVVTMFIAYFAANHDLHYIVEDYLGITTKIAEIGVIALLIKQYIDQSNNDSKLINN